MDLKTWKSEGKYFDYVKSDSVKARIFYRESVNNHPVHLLLIHGFPTASWDWHKVWPGLENEFNLIAPDMLGFGFSDKPAGYTYSIMEQADIHEKLLEKLEIKETHILAHDYGDTVTQELLARFLERQKNNEKGLTIKSICFLNGGLFPEAHNARLIQKLLNSPLGKIITLFMNKRTLKKNFQEIFGSNTQPTDREIDDFWELVSHNNGIKVFHKLIAYLNERKKYRERWVGALQKSNIHLRLIDGVEDPISGKNIADRYRELVPEPDIVLLENIGHYPNVEAPEAVIEHFIEFYEKNISERVLKK